jgi:hypothetical protein
VALPAGLLNPDPQRISVGKNQGFFLKKNPAQCLFLFFLGFLFFWVLFFWVFLSFLGFFYPEERVFRVFQFQESFGCIQTLKIIITLTN